mmetsp:Transcript_39483/g.62667  ORF Transcript_39483/g.62667 Transcript_39483/m.62667 type:complete len:218 (-) Transcript_39483:128-781(-)
MQSMLRACAESCPNDDIFAQSFEVNANDLPRLALGRAEPRFNSMPIGKQLRLPDPPVKGDALAGKKLALPDPPATCSALIGKPCDTLPKIRRNTESSLCNRSLEAQREELENSIVAKEALRHDLSSMSTFLELSFESSGIERQFCVYRRLLGVEFKKRAGGPTKISKVNRGSYGSELGLEDGMVLKSIGGKEVSQLTFDETQASLKNALMALPRHFC